KNPCETLRRPKRAQPTCQEVDEPTLETLLAGVNDPRDRALFALFLGSGLRLSEVHQLDRCSISVEEEVGPDGQTRILGVGKGIGKGNKERLFLVDSETVQIVAAY